MKSGGAGKKYKNVWTVKDERALNAKAWVDKELIRVTQGAMEILRTGGVPETGESSPGGKTRGSRGGIVERTVKFKNGNERVQKVCKDCGKVMKSDYVRCPYCE